MKKITLDGELFTLQGKPFMVKDTNSTMTVRDVLTDILCMSKPRHGYDVIRQIDLAKKIYEGNGVIEIEDADAEFVNRLLADNETGYVAIVIAQVKKAVSQ